MLGCPRAAKEGADPTRARGQGCSLAWLPRPAPEAAHSWPEHTPWGDLGISPRFWVINMTQLLPACWPSLFFSCSFLCLLAFLFPVLWLFDDQDLSLPPGSCCLPSAHSSFQGRVAARACHLQRRVEMENTLGGSKVHTLLSLLQLHWRLLPDVIQLSHRHPVAGWPSCSEAFTVTPTKPSVDPWVLFLSGMHSPVLLQSCIGVLSAIYKLTGKCNHCPSTDRTTVIKFFTWKKVEKKFLYLCILAIQRKVQLTLKMSK